MKIEGQRIKIRRMSREGSTVTEYGVDAKHAISEAEEVLRAARERGALVVTDEPNGEQEILREDYVSPETENVFVVEPIAGG